MRPRSRLPVEADARSGGLLGTVLETVPALVVVLDCHGRILVFNRACRELSGYSREDVAERPIWELLIPPDERSLVRAHFTDLRAGNFPASFCNNWVARNGELCPIQWTNSAVVAESGDVSLVIGTGLDLRRELQAEAVAEALRASEARYASIISIAADAIISVDAEQRIVVFNKGAEEIFGWPASAMIGQRLEMLIPERFRSAHSEQHIPAFAAASIPARRMAERREIFGLRSNGEEFPAEASISKLNVGSHRLFTVVLRDVTARKRLEARRQFMAEVSTVLNSSLDYAITLRELARLTVARLADFCVVDGVSADSRIERIEAAHRDAARAELARRFRDLPLDRNRPHLAAEPLGTRRSSLIEALSPEDIAGLAQSSEHHTLLSELEPVSYIGVPLIAREQLLGSLVLVSSTRAYDADDLAVAEELAWRAAVAIDNARLYDEAQRAVVARDDVVGIVAHDLGNPISAIRIGSSLLLREFADEAVERPVRQHLHAIRASTEQMERLIANLLDLRRIESGRLTLERRQLSPVALLESVRPMFELLAGDRGIRFEIVAAKSAPALILADPDRLRQVLENLLGNAFKFTGSGGTVSLAVAGAGSDALFVVRDSGRGIEAAHIPHLFDRFWQAERSSRRSIGLGLSIVRGIVDAHGGRIRVESEPGRGAAFHFTIPIDGVAAASATDATDAAPVR
jgi:PAS domain S-box-containing protein